MTLDEAIKHCEEKAEELNKEVLKQANLCNAKEVADCQECAREHEQLANWLEELVELRKDKRPQGEWLEHYYSHFEGAGIECSVCGKDVEYWADHYKEPNFCPNCGAKMSS